MLDNLLDIEVAYSLLRGGVEDNKKNSIDINYEKLKTKIEVKCVSLEELSFTVTMIWSCWSDWYWFCVSRWSTSHQVRLS